MLERTERLALPYDGASKATLRGRSCMAYVKKVSRRCKSYHEQDVEKREVTW